MLHNLQLAAIVKEGTSTRLMQIPLRQAEQQTLAQDWTEQYQDFLDNIQEIDFNIGYQPEGHERFRVAPYTLPDWIASESEQTVATLDSLTNPEEYIRSLKAIVAFVRDGNKKVILFQNFSQSHVIKPGRFLLLQHDTYEIAGKPGLTLNKRLAAVFFPTDEKLLFRNFRSVNSFLQLTDFYEEATEQEILEVLSHERLRAEDAEALATDANQWFKKRFAMLRDSRLLDEYTPRQIQIRARQHDVTVTISGGKMVFPSDRKAAKKLLQFLNEELYRGPITRKLFETNSRREAD